MMDCYCDDDPPTVYSTRKIKAARKEHQCEECARTIKIGESYQNTFGVWEGHFDTFATCSHCQSLRDFVTISTPCYCWSHGDGFDGLKDHLADCCYRAPNEMKGVMFRAGRLAVAIKKACHPTPPVTGGRKP